MELGPRTQDALHAVLGRDERARETWQREDFDHYDKLTEHYGFDGEVIPFRAWMILFDVPERILKQEWLLLRDCERVLVSTVWLGIDHNHMRFLRFSERIGGMLADLGDDPELLELDTRPWIFETMAFRSAPAWNDVFARMGDELGQWRQATWEEALLQHAAAAAMALSGILLREDDALSA